jgi:signal transduction histidine kinase
LITLFTDLQYTRSILKPLKKITGKLSGISSPSTFDTNPVKTTTSDFARLDEVLCDLMIQTEESFRKEKEITVNISHELLTPVSILRSKLENILLMGDAGPGMSARIEESLKTLHRLQSLVNSLLLIARIESNQYILGDSFSVKELLSEIISELKPIAEDKKVILKEEMRYDLQFNKANRPLIFSMFYNVVNNSVKNTFAGGMVIVSSVIEHERLKLLIEDTGKGMNEAQLNELFFRFKTRKDNGGDGTGIGLAIAKSIADLHKIEVSVISEPEKGTTFSFIFPENS